VNVPQELQIAPGRKARHERRRSRPAYPLPECAAAKIASANVIIQNQGSFEETWNMVVAEWKKITPQSDTIQTVVKPESGEFSVARGRPRDSVAIAELITRLSGGAKTMTQDDVMAAFGEKAFMLLQAGGKAVGVAGWQVENLVARTTEFFIDALLPLNLPLKPWWKKWNAPRLTCSVKPPCSSLPPPCQPTRLPGNNSATKCAPRKRLASRPGPMPRSNRPNRIPACSSSNSGKTGSCARFIVSAQATGHQGKGVCLAQMAVFAQYFMTNYCFP
jgi:hypothetical protein